MFFVFCSEWFGIDDLNLYSIEIHIYRKEYQHLGYLSYSCFFFPDASISNLIVKQ